MAAMNTASLGSTMSLKSVGSGPKLSHVNVSAPASTMVMGPLRIHAMKRIQGQLGFAAVDSALARIAAHPKYMKQIKTRTAVQSEERQAEELEEVNEEPMSEENGLSKWLYPPEEELPDDKEMTIFDHLEELRDRLLISVVAVGVAIAGCFVFAKDLIVLLEKPVYSLGVRFLALSPGEYFFTTLKVSGYCGLLLGSPVILYEIIAFVVPGLTRSERKLLGPVVFGSSFLFYAGLAFSYAILTPAALNFFVSYAEGVVESLWSIDQYFEFVLVLMFSTGLSFQVPIIQLLLGQTGLVSGDQMLSVWRYVVVGAVVAAAVLTPSTDPLTQCLLAGPLIGLYMGGAFAVKLLINNREPLELED